MIWLVGLLGLLGLGAGVAALLADDIAGKKFSVLGERETGKTTLINFLTTGTLPKTYVQTLYPKETVENDLELKELKLKIEKSKRCAWRRRLLGRLEGYYPNSRYRAVSAKNR